MDNNPEITIEVQDHYFGGLEGLKSILNDYYENELKQLNEDDRKAARHFLEEGLIVSGRRVSVTEGVEKERYNIERPLLEKLLDSRLIRVENTHLGKSYEISHDTLVPPIIESYKKRKIIEKQLKAEQLLKEEKDKLAIEKKKRQRARIYAITGFTLFFLALVMGWTAYNQSSHIKKVAKAGNIRGKGYQIAKNNPSIALRLAQASLEADPDNTNSKHLMRDLLSVYPPHFCSDELWIGDYVSDLAFFPNNQYFISVAWNGVMEKWTATGDSIFHIQAHQEAVHAVTISPNGQYILTGSVDNTSKLWDAEGNFIRNIGEHLTDVQIVSFTPNGNQIITGSWDGVLKLWSLEGELLHNFIGHKDVINDLAISSDGKFLVSAGWDKKIIVWDLENFQQHKIIDDFYYGIESVAFIKDSLKFWTNDWEGKLQLWDINGIKSNEIKLDGITASDIAISPAGNTIFLAQSNHIVRELDFEGNEIRQFKNHSNEVMSIDISNDGKYMTSGGIDYKVSVWPLWGLEEKSIRAPCGINSFALSTNERKILVGGLDSIAYLLDQNGNVLYKLTGHKQQITAVSISPDGQHMATGGVDNSIIIWNSEGEKIVKIDTFTSDVNTLVFSPDSKRILAGSNTFEAKTFDLEGNTLQTFKGHTSDIRSVKFSPNGEYILTGSRDFTARLWQEDGTLVNKFLGHNKDIYTVDFSNDGKYILTGGDDKTVRLWSISGKELVILSGFTAKIYKAGFSPDNKYILTSSRDNVIKIWDINGNEIQSYLGHDEFITDIKFSLDGKYIWSADKKGNIKRWMLWDTFTASDCLIKLNIEQRIYHGLAPSFNTDSTTKKIKVAMHYERGSPNYHLIRCKKFLFHSQYRSKLGPPNRRINNEKELAKTYSIKAFHSLALSEKRFFQSKCSAIMLNMFDNWIFKKPPPGFYENILIFSYADHCLLDMLKGEFEQAYQLNKLGTIYTAGWPKVQTYLKTRLALASFYNGDYESSKIKLLEVKDLKLYSFEHQGKDFSIPYAMNHGTDLDTTLTLGDLILQDIDLLTEHGITNSEVPSLRALLLE